MAIVGAAVFVLVLLGAIFLWIGTGRAGRTFSRGPGSVSGELNVLRARVAELEAMHVDARAQLALRNRALRACIDQLRDLQKSSARLDSVLRDAAAAL